MRKIFIFIMACSFSSLLFFGQVSALTSSDWFSILNNSIYYNGQQTCTQLSNGTLLSLNSSKAAWNSTIQGPYYLEAFAINVLEDLASTTNQPQSNALTQQHVLALVAWSWAEGGDINNTDLFNPLNSSQAVKASTVQTTGDMAYVSFNSGVQATVQTMIGSFQNRIAEVLLNPNSSATEVMQTVAYFQSYPGNLAWASSDSLSNQQAYLSGLLANVVQAQSNYNFEASTEMGTRIFEEQNNMHVPYSELKYGNSTSSPESQSTTVSSVASNLACSSSLAIGSGPSGYANPLRDVSQLKPERIDQGVDYAGSGPVYALGDGTIVNLVNSGWNYGGNDAFISEKLSSGPAAGDYVYVSEGCVAASGLSIGETVTSSTQLCTMINPGSTGIETGWANPPGDGFSLALITGEWDGSDPTALGQNYSQLLTSLGAPSGVLDGTVTGTIPAGWPTW